jgi:two-component system sensor histidine kinase HydH
MASADPSPSPAPGRGAARAAVSPAHAAPTTLAAPAGDSVKPYGWPSLWAPRTVLLVWLPIALIGVAHYSTGPELLWVHNVLRRLYYLPIIVAAFQAGLRGGVAAAVVASLSYLPHAFLHMGHLAHTDPGTALEVVLYNLAGIVAGYLAAAERQRRAELREALEEQQRLQKQLVRAGRLGALGEVVAGIAHEIRNPLHALRGTAEIVDPLVPKGTDERRMWEIHVSELERLDRVATRFLSFATPKPIEPQPLDLREVAERLVDLVGADARKKGARMVTDLPDEAVMVRGDRDQLAQVALNIALNALRAVAPAGGTIRVGVRGRARSAPHQMPALVIENDGPPIAEEELEHLFDPFHGGAEGGAGLGLSISERIAEQHGGFIEASNAGLGVMFAVYLPPA